MDDILNTALGLILLQLFSRLLTFILNQAIVRLASPEALGTSSIQFDVLINTVLFLSREGIRGALSRLQDDFDPKMQTQHKTNGLRRQQQIINGCFIPIPLGVIIASLLFTIYGITVERSTALQSHFWPALSFYYGAVLMEIISEPSFIHHILTNRTNRRIKIEGMAVIIRILITLTIVLMGYRNGKDWALLGFSIGQFGYGSALVIGLWSQNTNASAPSTLTLLPRPIDIPTRQTHHTTSLIDRYLAQSDLNLCYALLRQSLIKQFLTEGDKMIISRICPISHQGGYALAMNYGSLVARIVFQPIEETSRLYFSKTLTSTSKTEEQKSEPLRRAMDLLRCLIQFYIYLTLIFISFGPPYVFTILRIILGYRSAYLKQGIHSTVVNVLRSYCGLLPLLALNGILEAFVQSVANEKELNKISKLMTLWCMIFIGSVIILNKSFVQDFLNISSEVSMVWSTSLNMMCRIVYGLIFIKRYSKIEFLKNSYCLDWLPSPITIISLILSSVLIRISERELERSILIGKMMIEDRRIVRHLAIGIINFLITGFIMIIFERKRIKNLVQVIMKKSKDD